MRKFKFHAWLGAGIRQHRGNRLSSDHRSQDEKLFQAMDQNDFSSENLSPQTNEQAEKGQDERHTQQKSQIVFATGIVDLIHVHVRVKER